MTQALSLSVTANRQSLLNDAERVYWECLRAHDVSESSPEGKTYFIRNRERSQIYASTSIRSATWNGTTSTLNPYSVNTAVNPHPQYADAIQKNAYWYMYSFRPDGTVERYGDMAAEVTPKYIYQPYIDSVAAAYKDPYLNAFSRYLGKWNADRGTEAYSLNYNPGGSVLRERPLMAVWQDPTVRCRRASTRTIRWPA